MRNPDYDIVEDVTINTVWSMLNAQSDEVPCFWSQILTAGQLASDAGQLEKAIQQKLALYFVLQKEKTSESPQNYERLPNIPCCRKLFEPPE